MINLTKCRICKGTDLYKFISLGPIPLPNAFLKSEQIESEIFYPLDACFCNKCGMVQIAQVVDPVIMFRDYAYFTGASKPMHVHFDSMASAIVKKFKLPRGSLVADIGSNDGTLLQKFKDKGMRVLGVEPSENVAQYANDNGIDTINEYFGADKARMISSLRGNPKIITATNVFAHVNNIDDFMDGIYFWLDDQGVFIIEVPYLSELIKKVEFDTIYHEHLSYFAVRPLATLFKRWGMSIIEVEQIGVHGGTIRVYVAKGEHEPSLAVEELIRKEIELGLDKAETYKNFAKKVHFIRSELVYMLNDLKKGGAKIVGYGASAKGNILLNYCNIGTDIIDYIADTTAYKQGLLNPGMHIPVYGFDEFYTAPPDYALLLIWNYAEAILKKESEYIRLGGKFIIPIPKPFIEG